MLKEYYLKKLDGNGRAAYGTVRGAIASSAPSCTLGGTSVEGSFVVHDAVVFDHPEFINYPALFFLPSPSATATELHFSYAQADRAQYNAALTELLNKIQNKLGPSADDYAVCKAIYDTLAEELSYKTEVFNEYAETVNNNRSASVKAEYLLRNGLYFTAYGAAVTRTAVCEGIAKLFKIICDRFSLECAVAEACSKGGNPDLPDHMLNVVEIEGKRAFVDVTGGLKDERTGRINYRFFLMPASVVGRYFEVKEDFGCNDESLNEYARRGATGGERGLRKCVEALACRGGTGVIDYRYKGGLDDDALGRLFTDVLDYYLAEGFQITHVSVENGFCSAIITNEGGY